MELHTFFCVKFYLFTEIKTLNLQVKALFSFFYDALVITLIHGVNILHADRKMYEKNLKISHLMQIQAEPVL